MKKIMLFATIVAMSMAVAMPANAQSRKEKKAAKKAQWEMEQKQKAEEAALLHQMRMDSIKRANEERAEAEERARDRKRRREDQKDAMEQILEGGVQLIYTPCMDEFLALNKVPEQMAAQGIGTGQQTQELAQKVANERAIDDIGHRFAGVVKNAMESYNKDTSTPKGNRVTEGSLEGMVLSVGEKAINEFYIVDCRQFAKDRYNQWICYEALYVPMNKVLDAILQEVKDVDVDKAMFRKRMLRYRSNVQKWKNNTMKPFISILLICLPVVAFAQNDREMPQWVTQLPSSNPQKHFYYRVTVGEGTTYDKAYANAFAKAIMEAKWKLGVKVKVSDDMAALEDQVTNAVNVQEQYMEIPINKVCDYWEEYRPVASAKQIRLYVLWQVADDGRYEPRFEDFTNCQ